MKILSNVNFSLKETINAESATKVLKNFAGEILKVTGLLVAQKEVANAETGEIEVTKIGILKTDNGELISSISTTAISSIETMIQVFTENNMLDEISKGLGIKVDSDKSSKGREFFHLTIQ